MKIYVAGPVSGVPNHNKKAFADACNRLSLSGVQTINPIELCAPIASNWRGTDQELWNACMKRNIEELVKADAVALLPGWQDSAGATFEREIALKLSITCLSIEEYYKILNV